MFGGLFRLGLDEEPTIESDGSLVVHGHVQELREMFLLAFEIGIEQRRIALAAAPEDIAGPGEFVGDLDCFLNLRSGERKHVGIATRRRAVHVARM